MFLLRFSSIIVGSELSKILCHNLYLPRYRGGPNQPSPGTEEPKKTLKKPVKIKLRLGCKILRTLEYTLTSYSLHLFLSGINVLASACRFAAGILVLFYAILLFVSYRLQILWTKTRQVFKGFLIMLLKRKLKYLAGMTRRYFFLLIFKNMLK